MTRVEPALANNNTAVGASALFNNVDGSENTAVGTGAGPNVITGFNNTYVGDFVGTHAADESSTIRIGDLSNGNGAGSLAVLHRWYLQQLPACWRQRCCSYSGPC